jgi:hypothetical protein
VGLVIQLRRYQESPRIRENCRGDGYIHWTIRFVPAEERAPLISLSAEKCEADRKRQK